MDIIGMGDTDEPKLQLSREFPTFGIEAFPDGRIQLWIGDTEGAHTPPLSDESIDALIRNLQTVKKNRGSWDVTWVAPYST